MMSTVLQRIQPKESEAQGREWEAGKAESGLCSYINAKCQWKVKCRSCTWPICDTGNWQLHTNISGCPGYKISLQHGRRQEWTGSSISSKFAMTSKRRSRSWRRSTTVALCVILHVKKNMSTLAFFGISMKGNCFFDRPQFFKYIACMQLLRFAVRISPHDHPGATSASSSSSSAISSAPMFLDSANHVRKQCCVSLSI